jgi:hypothetical protein
MTSFVEFHGHGFWCRNTVLREWVRAVLAAAKTLPDPPPWLPKACGYWDAVACAAKSGRADLRLHADVTDPERQRECERLFAAAADRPLPPAVRRAAVLAVALVRGELAGAMPTALEYWADDEWHDPDVGRPAVAARATCPECGAVATATATERPVECPRCGLLFEPPAPLPVARAVRRKPPEEGTGPQRHARRPGQVGEDAGRGWQRYKRFRVRLIIVAALTLGVVTIICTKFRILYIPLLGCALNASSQFCARTVQF